MISLLLSRQHIADGGTCLSNTLADVVSKTVSRLQLLTSTSMIGRTDTKFDGRATSVAEWLPVIIDPSCIRISHHGHVCASKMIRYENDGQGSWTMDMATTAGRIAMMARACMHPHVAPSHSGRRRAKTLRHCSSTRSTLLRFWVRYTQILLVHRFQILVPTQLNNDLDSFRFWSKAYNKYMRSRYCFDIITIFNKYKLDSTKKPVMINYCSSFGTIIFRL